MKENNPSKLKTYRIHYEVFGGFIATGPQSYIVATASNPIEAIEMHYKDKDVERFQNSPYMQPFGPPTLTPSSSTRRIITKRKWAGFKNLLAKISIYEVREESIYQYEYTKGINISVSLLKVVEV